MSKYVHVLIIEDDDINALAMEVALQTLDKVNVFTRRIAKLSALDTLDHFIPEVIFLDHHLEEEKGIDAIPNLQRQFPDAAIAVLSGQMDVSMFSKAYELGATTYIRKDEDSIDNVRNYIQAYVSRNSFTNNLWGSFFEKLKSKKINSKKQLTLIDDDSLYLFALQYKLSCNPNLTVEAYSKLEDFNPQWDKKPDILVLDHQLENNVIQVETIEHIRTHCPKTKIIMLSSNESIALATELRSHVDEYLYKNEDSFHVLEQLIVN